MLCEMCLLAAYPTYHLYHSPHCHPPDALVELGLMASGEGAVPLGRLVADPALVEAVMGLLDTPGEWTWGLTGREG
jgi:hypothetical protein